MKSKFIWNTYIDSLNINYVKFRVNTLYKNKSFKSIDEYEKVQTVLFSKIEELNTQIKNSIIEVLNELYPEVEILIYDSRTMNKDESILGSILIKGIKNKSEIVDMRIYFEKVTGFKLIIDNFDDLSEDTKKSLSELI